MDPQKNNQYYLLAQKRLKNDVITAANRSIIKIPESDECCNKSTASMSLFQRLGNNNNRTTGQIQDLIIVESSQTIFLKVVDDDTNTDTDDGHHLPVMHVDEGSEYHLNFFDTIEESASRRSSNRSSSTPEYSDPGSIGSPLQLQEQHQQPQLLIIQPRQQYQQQQHQGQGQSSSTTITSNSEPTSPSTLSSPSSPVTTSSSSSSCIATSKSSTTQLATTLLLPELQLASTDAISSIENLNGCGTIEILKSNGQIYQNQLSNQLTTTDRVNCSEQIDNQQILTIDDNNCTIRGSSSSSSSSSLSSSSSPSSSSSKGFVQLCRVCGDKASGFHYGVTSCEGCKGFFRRSIHKQIEYRCLKDGHCLVIRLNRNRCQFCRFKKCLTVGMSRDSVRYGRVPKRSRDVIVINEGGKSPTTEFTNNNNNNGIVITTGITTKKDSNVMQTINASELSVYDVILCVAQSHITHCAYTNDLVKDLIRRPMDIKHILNNISDFDGDHDMDDDQDNANEKEDKLQENNKIIARSKTEIDFDRQKIYLWQQFANRITVDIQRVVEFAKRVPGFCNFPQDDQLILIKLGFFELWISQISKIVINSSLTFNDGCYLTKEQLVILYNNEFLTSFLKFTSGFNKCDLSDTEIGLFSALVLLASNRNGITAPKLISKSRDQIAEALRVQIARSRPQSNLSIQIMPALEAKLPELRALGAQHLLHLDWVRSNFKKIKLPPLFAELFDISSDNNNNNTTNNNKNV